MSDVALVTGGAGFIGRHLVSALLAEGMAVRVLDPAPPDDRLSAAVDYRQGSILDATDLGLALEGTTEVYHLAAVAHLWAWPSSLFRTVNAEGTRSVLDAAARAGARRTVVTATEVILRGWRDRNPAPVTEADVPPRAAALAGPYCVSKAAAHALALRAQQGGAPVTIVYPTVPIGPFDHAMTAPTRMIRDYVAGATPAVVDGVLNLVPVEDVARGHILAARRGEPNGRYILGGDNLRLSEILTMLQRLTGRPMPKTRIPFWLAYATGVASTAFADHVTHRPPRAPLEGVRLTRVPRHIDSSHARHVLGWRPGSVEAALKRALDWLVDAGHLPDIGPKAGVKETGRVKG